MLENDPIFIKPPVRQTMSWSEESETVISAKEYANQLVANNFDGVSERALILQVATDQRIEKRLAAAAVDLLESTGTVIKNWSTGLITETRI
jgi:hypothetical protein